MLRQSAICCPTSWVQRNDKLDVIPVSRLPHLPLTPPSLVPHSAHLGLCDALTGHGKMAPAWHFPFTKHSLVSTRFCCPSPRVPCSCCPPVRLGESWSRTELPTRRPACHTPPTRAHASQPALLGSQIDCLLTRPHTGLCPIQSHRRQSYRVCPTGPIQPRHEQGTPSTSSAPIRSTAAQC
jgi:hypothetical protein